MTRYTSDGRVSFLMGVKGSHVIKQALDYS